MILLWLLGLLLGGGLLAWALERRHRDAPGWVAVAALLGALALVVALWAGGGGTPWWAEVQLPWIPYFGISFHLGIDGLSLLLVALALFLGLMAVAAAWREIERRRGFFYFNLLWSVAGAVGVFLALDLFLFAVFWEAMLVPMYLIIAIWGHERRIYAAIKFFLFTQASGLLMLVAIIALALLHAHQSGTLTFDYSALLGTQLSTTAQWWLMGGFLAAFLVKLPAVPLHTWLPDAHTEAPTPGSVLLAGILLKTGAYGLIRFVVPLFPDAALAFTPIALTLGVLSILYGALLAFGQRDLKRLVAYTSVSHMGFILLGVFAWNTIALQGSVVQMLAHGLSTGALFMLVGALQARIHTRDLERMGGLWAPAPRLAAIALFFAIAALGLPGMGNFIGEFLVLLGTFRASVGAAVAAAFGLILSAAYALRLVQRAFHGPPGEVGHCPDLRPSEVATLLAVALVLVAIGLYPQPLFDTARGALAGLEHLAALPGQIAMGGLP